MLHVDSCKLHFGFINIPKATRFHYAYPSKPRWIYVNLHSLESFLFYSDCRMNWYRFMTGLGRENNLLFVQSKWLNFFKSESSVGCLNAALTVLALQWIVNGSSSWYFIIFLNENRIMQMFVPKEELTQPPLIQRSINFPSIFSKRLNTTFFLVS